MRPLNMESHKDALEKLGFSMIENVFSADELDALATAIHSADQQNEAFRRTDDLFAIRAVLQTIPNINNIIWNDALVDIIHTVLGPDYFVVKSIYFDKPPSSNWWVAWHQDMTISVDKKVVADNFTLWTQKQGQIAVQAPRHILENIFTLRIHLDDCDASNGALKVIPGSHNNGIVRPATIDPAREVLCSVKAGGVMIMRPLLMHASGRSNSLARQRRVIHIECANQALPYGMQWSEYGAIDRHAS